MLVLVVDDQEGFRRLAHVMLDTAGEFQVVAEAADGDEAIARVEELRPDLVLMDVHMPRMNGLEATRRIVALYPETQVVMMSTMSGKELSRASLDAGAIAFISKGRLSLKTLRDAIGPRLSLLASLPRRSADG